MADVLVHRSALDLDSWNLSWRLDGGLMAERFALAAPGFSLFYNLGGRVASGFQFRTNFPECVCVYIDR